MECVTDFPDVAVLRGPITFILSVPLSSWLSRVINIDCGSCVAMYANIIIRMLSLNNSPSSFVLLISPTSYSCWLIHSCFASITLSLYVFVLRSDIDLCLCLCCLLYSCCFSCFCCAHSHPCSLHILHIAMFCSGWHHLEYLRNLARRLIKCLPLPHRSAVFIPGRKTVLWTIPRN